MSKTTGLGMFCWVDGYDLSGDIGSIGHINGGPKPLELTGIDKGGYERAGGLRDGGFGFTAWFNPAASQAHPVLSTLPTADRAAMTGLGSTIGSPAACLIGKQIGYDGKRANDGAFTLDVEAQSNAYGLEWAQLLTAGKRVDTVATNGASLDTAASASFGAQLYLQVFAFTGTDVTIKLQDSADNSSFTDVTGGAFTAVTTAPQSQRLQLGAAATVRRYLRIATTTSGGFTSVTFAVGVNKNNVTVAF
jgi:hypothetical protein